MSENKKFEGIWIPKEIWENKELGWSEKLMLVQIKNLDNDFGCTMKNEDFSKFFNLSEDRVSRIIRELVKKKYVFSKITRHSNNKTSRKLKVDRIKFNGISEEELKKHLDNQNGENTDKVIGENTDEVIGENNEYINKYLNNINKKDSLSDNKLSDVEAAIKIYKEIENLPKVISFSDKRKKHINARLKEYGLKTFKETLIKASESSFLKSHLGKKNFYDFDWIINPNNFLKILEDKYQDRNKISNEKEIGLEELFG